MSRLGPWTLVRSEYPPVGVFVRVLVPGGREKTAKLEANVWIDEDGKILTGDDQPMVWRAVDE